MPTYPLLRILFLIILFSVSPQMMLPALASSIGVVPAPSRPSPGSPAMLLQEGWGQVIKGDLAAAKRSFEEAKKKNSQDHWALLGLAEVAMRENKPEKARNFLQEAIKAAPKQVDVHRAWGRFLFMQRQYREAEVAAKKALGLDPNAVGVHLDLADLYLGPLKRPMEAAQHYETVLKLEASNAGAHYGLAHARIALNQMDDATAHLKEAGRLAPTNPLPHMSMARLAVARKDYDGALGELDAALAARADFVAARLEKGDIWQLKGDDVKALAEYAEVTKQDPRSVEGSLKSAVIHERHQRPVEVEQAYRIAIERAPGNPIAYNNLAWLLAEEKARLDESLTLAKKAVDLAPRVSQFYDTLGWVYRARGELAQAQQALEKGVKLSSDRPELLYRLGVVYAERGRTREAAESLKKALALKSDFTGADDARKRLEALGQTQRGRS